MKSVLVFYVLWRESSLVTEDWNSLSLLDKRSLQLEVYVLQYNKNAKNVY